jgi:hypothetical protein
MAGRCSPTRRPSSCASVVRARHEGLFGGATVSGPDAISGAFRKPSRPTAQANPRHFQGSRARPDIGRPRCCVARPEKTGINSGLLQMSWRAATRAKPVRTPAHQMLCRPIRKNGNQFADSPDVVLDSEPQPREAPAKVVGNRPAVGSAVRHSTWGSRGLPCRLYGTLYDYVQEPGRNRPGRQHLCHAERSEGLWGDRKTPSGEPNVPRPARRRGGLPG